MTHDGVRVPAIVLAGGKASPEFAAAAGVEKRCLLRVRGKTLLEIVVDALRSSERVGRILVVGDLAVPEGLEKVAEGDTFVANLFRGLEWCRDEPYALVATSDMPFIRGETVSRLVERGEALQADFVYPIVPVDLCLQAYPTMHRTSLPLREGRFTGGNAVLLRPNVFLEQRSYIEQAYAQRKRPLRLAMMLGPGIALAVAVSLMTRRGLVRLPTLERAATKLLHAKARALIMSDPDIAADIDRPGDLEALPEQA